MINPKLRKRIDDALARKDRVLLAIAGPPASGKSSLAEALCREFDQKARGAVVLPMDGFHLDNDVLDAKSLRAVKGSPASFDADAFIDMVRKIKKGQHVFAPLFDRTLDLSKAGAIEISDQRLIIIEGNYLLFDQAPWRELAQYWDISSRLNPPLEEIHKRCIERWIAHGHSEEEAKARAKNNDLVNARLIMDHPLPADIEL